VNLPIGSAGWQRFERAAAACGRARDACYHLFAMVPMPCSRSRHASDHAAGHAAGHASGDPACRVAHGARRGQTVTLARSGPRHTALVAALIAALITAALVGGCGFKTPLEIPKKPVPVKPAS